jgi:WG containing repeat
MEKIIYFALFTFTFTFNLLAYCDETGSYNKTWTTQAIEKENGREAREKYYKTLTLEEKMSISDFERYPNLMMTCSMGFSDGLAKIIVDGKAGFINIKGKIAIQPKYKNAGRFSEYLAPVQFENDKWGYINKKGEIVIKAQFDWALIFREGLALVQVSEKWGFIDIDGKVVVKPQFIHANSFSERLAKAQIWGIDNLYSEGFKVLKTGYISKTGDWIIKPTWDGGNNFEKGKTIVDQHLVDETTKKTYHGCFWIDNNGHKISKELETCSTTIKEPISIDESFSMFFDDYKTGYKNKSGKIIWKPTK